MVMRKAIPILFQKANMLLPMEDRFVAEAMLGKLAKWLRMMGYDILYQRSYREEDLARLLLGGRRLLSRRVEALARHPGVLLLRSDHVGEQLKELKSLGCLKLDRSRFFTRCLLCNVPLKDADPEAARSTLPDYVFHENPSGIRFCPECGRFFWPGTHRDRMLKQLEEWGL
jgi:uncharacterized protein with PIN domain